MNHILDVYHESSREERLAGTQWYSEAYNLAYQLAHTPDHRPAVTRDMVAGVIAALSPLTPWDRNKELAVRAVTDHKASGTLGNSVKAADRILSGEPVLDVLKSPKVRNFYLCIIGNPRAVCIDRHAFEVWQGKRYKDSERPTVTPKRYREAAEAYQRAADTLELRPSELQAITWLTWRRIHLTGTRYERFL